MSQTPPAADVATPAERGRLTLLRRVLFSLLALVTFFLLCEVALFGVSRIAYYFTVSRYNPATSQSGEDGARKYRIVTFGDSVTAGQGTAPRYSYPRQLEDLLNTSNEGDRFEVINNGVYALNSSRTADLLPGWLDEFQPDLIVVMTGCNNAWNYNNSHLEQLGLLNRKPWQILLNKTRTYRFLRVLIKRQKAGFGIAEAQRNLTPVLRDQMKISESVRPAVDPTARTLERQQRIFDDVQALNQLLEHDLGEILKVTRARGVQLVVMTYPFVPPYQDHRGITRQFTQTNKLIGVDNYGEFQKIKAVRPNLNLFSADRGHPNATGYRVMAAAIQKAMSENASHLGIEIAPPPDPLADFKDPEYLAALYEEVRASTLRPGADEYVWETLGHVAVEMESWEEAKAAFRKAFEVSGGAPQFYESLGNLMVQLGECDELEALRDEMAAQRGERSDIQFLLGLFRHACAEGGRAGPAGWGQGGGNRRDGATGGRPGDGDLGPPRGTDDGQDRSPPRPGLPAGSDPKDGESQQSEGGASGDDQSGGGGGQPPLR